MSVRFSDTVRGEIYPQVSVVNQLDERSTSCDRLAVLEDRHEFEEIRLGRG